MNYPTESPSKRQRLNLQSDVPHIHSPNIKSPEEQIPVAFSPEIHSPSSSTDNCASPSEALLITPVNEELSWNNLLIKTESNDADKDNKLVSVDHGIVVDRLLDIIKPGLFSDDLKSKGYDLSKLGLSVESLQNICLSLARSKHLNETQDIHMALTERDLWTKFHKIGNEMIITRSGRRMFPKLDVSITGLKPDVMYVFLIDIVPCDANRYRFSSTNREWVEIATIRHDSPKQIFIHPDGPKSGKYWMSAPVSFQKLKVQIASNCTENIAHILLDSQRKYQPRVHLVQSDAIFRVPMCPFKTFIFPETQFYAVTTYQSTRITEMKISNNPFAKGFRNPGTATQAASDRHGARGTTTMFIHLNAYGMPPFLAAGGAVRKAVKRFDSTKCKIK